MHAKYEVCISYGSRVIANVKVDNRQTDRQTNKQNKNNMPPPEDTKVIINIERRRNL